MTTGHRPRRKLVGHRLLYAISVFASLGVFLVSYISFQISALLVNSIEYNGSLDMIKGMDLSSCAFRCEYMKLIFASVMSGVITGPHFLQFFGGPDAIQVGTMVAVLEIGAFGEPRYTCRWWSVLNAAEWPIVTSIAAGRIGDIIGRKGTLFGGAVIFTIGGAIQTFTMGYKTMVVGRFVSGLGVGLLS